MSSADTKPLIALGYSSHMPQCLSIHSLLPSWLGHATGDHAQFAKRLQLLINAYVPSVSLSYVAIPTFL
jgi:hypothetical protein